MAATEVSPREVALAKKREAERKRKALRMAEDPAGFRERREASRKKWHDEHPDKWVESHRATNKKWKLANPDKVRAQYARRDPEVDRERARAYYAAHAEEQRAASAAYRKANPEKVRATNKAWREANPERMQELNARYRKENADKLREYYRGRKQQMAMNARQYHANPANRMRILVSVARRRAISMGLECDGLKELRGAPVPATCACCGSDLDCSRKNRDRSPSLDRHDARKGYVAGNVRVICFRCNKLKSDATIEEVEAILAYMRG